MAKEWINHKRSRGMTITLIVLALSIFVLSCIVGRYELVSPLLLFKVMLNNVGFDFTIESNIENIIQYIRFPRTLAALCVGGSLSLSGLMYQRLFNNPLVSPDILGVSAGCCVGFRKLQEISCQGRA